MKGYKLESVGTYLRADGMTYPLTIDGWNGHGYDDDEGTAFHILDIDPNDEGHEWWQSLSDDDRKIVEKVAHQVKYEEVS
jgi:hypothetical protein